MIPHLAHGRILLPQAHDNDAVGLADAALCPGGEAAVALVQHDAVEVFLLAQPAGQPVLMDAAHQGPGQQGGATGGRRQAKQETTYLSRAAAPSRCLMMSLVSRRVGPEGTT